MKNDAGINALPYWERRFQDDWEAYEGPRQSRFFAALALEHLPAWLLEAARRQRMSLADWGCAQGDGTEVLAGCLAPAQVTGIDFSATAIAQARERYPAVGFVEQDWLAGEQDAGQRFDIVFSSNTLEHFHHAPRVLERIARHAARAVVLALPYRELDREDEHFFTFLPRNIPAALGNGFRLVWSRVVDCGVLPETCWPGEQVFLVYADPQWLHAMDLSLEDCRVEAEAPRTAQEVAALAAAHAAELARRDEALQVRTAEVTSLQRSVAWQREELQNLSLAVSSSTEHAARLARELSQKDEAVAQLHEGLARELRTREAAEARQAELQSHMTALQGHNAALQAQHARLQRQVSERQAELERWQHENAGLRAQLEANIQQLEQQNLALLDQLGQANGHIEGLRRQLDAQLQEGEFRRQELARVSDWASRIADKPLSYGMRRSAYLFARSVYRALPLAEGGKQKLKSAFHALARRGSGRAPAVGPAASAALPRLAAGQGEQTPAARAERMPVEEVPPPRRIVPHEGERDVFVFAVIDWHFRIQRPQHLARSLAQAGRRVFFISNVFVDAAQPGYQLEKLDPALGLYQVKLHVRGAPAIYFAAPAPQVVRDLQSSMAELLADFGALSSVSLVEHPFWFPLVTTLPNSLWVYDCMDHHEGFGNVPPELVGIERQMLHASDLVVVTSTWLQSFASESSRNLALVRNAVEYDFFCQRPAEVFRDAGGRRIIGYFGAIAEWFDIELVRRLAVAHPACLLLLVGNDTVGAGARLADLPNVQFTGEVPYRTLPYYLYAFDVCLLPFQVSELTLATNPVKVYEYLAAGKPVVCVDLPEIAQFGDLVRRAATHEAFIEAVSEALGEAGTEPLVARRRAFAAEQTWRHRGEALVQAMRALELPRVSVVVLTYNNLSLTQACLESVLRESDYPNLELVIVDNASTDGSREYLQQFAAEHPGVRLVLNETNLGFAAGNNVGLAAATGDYLAILNNDTVVTRGWVLGLLRHLQRDDSIGLVGPVTNNIGNGARVETGYQRIEDMPDEAFRITLAAMGEAFPLRTAAFFCVMLPRTVYQRCGPICEDYGRGFFEDDDYCRQVERHGLKVVCAEDVFVHHQLSASFGKLPSAERQALFDANRARYEARWGPWVPHTYVRAARLVRRLPGERREGAPPAPASGGGRLAEDVVAAADAEPAPALDAGGASAGPAPAPVSSPVTAETGLQSVVASASEATLAPQVPELEVAGIDPEVVARSAEAAAEVVARARFAWAPEPGPLPSAEALLKLGLPPADRLARECCLHGQCPVCGRQGRFFYRDRALWRETLNCEHCLCTSRYRSIARGILRAIGEIAEVRADALADLPADTGRRRLAVYDTQPPFYYLPCAYPLPDLLKRTGWIDVHLSQYKPQMVPGAMVAPGITNQNLERLTYASASLDIVITSDVMEHVRLDDRAHSEIHRVLRPGGAYVFTVPHDLTMETTQVRVSTPVPDDPAQDELLMEPEYHGDTNGDGSGVLAYRRYGRDLLRRLEELGFDVEYARLPLPHQGVLQTELFYCRKRGA